MTLGEILRVLQRRYWIILVGALIAGLVAALLSFVWPPSYESQALILITKLRPSVTLDARYQTVAEENVVNLSVQEEQVRRQTLVGLATNADLVQEVIDRLGVALSQGERSLTGILRMVDIGTDGNLITITAKASDPEKAAAIANAWAGAYAETVNRLYSTTSPSEAEIQVQVDQARASYDAAKQDLQAYLKVSQENELLRQIEQKQQILSDLQSVHLAAARDQAAQLLARRDRAERLLLDAQALRTQLAGAPVSASLTPGEDFGLFMVEGLAYGLGEVLSTTLDLNVAWQRDTSLTTGQAIAYLDRLVDTLETDRSNTRSALEALSLALLAGQELLGYGPNGDSIAGLQLAISDLQARLEREHIKKVDLTNARDVAQQSYLTLVRKAAEVRISSETTGVEVKVASSAQAPEEPAFPRPLPTIVLGLLAGALAGLAFLFLLELWPRPETKAAA
jgi:uncharacterized protein involved in exopolysaccharide biosynthesis